MSRRNDRRGGYNPTLAEIRRDVAGVCCWCLACSHLKVLPLDQLLARLGGDFPYHQLAGRLRCTRCGARQAETRPDWPSPGVIAHHGPCKW